MTKAMMENIQRVNSFLENYKDGDELKLYISASERATLKEYVIDHPKGGKSFCFVPGIFKPGFLEQDFRLKKRS